MRANKIKKTISISLFIITFIFAAVMMMPLVFALSTSLKPPNAPMSIDLIVDNMGIENYIVILQDPSNPIPRWFLNSVVSAGSHVVLYLIVTSLAAFAFARLSFPGRDKLFWVCMMSLMVPGIINFVPNYVTIFRLGWVNTLLPMIFTGLGGVFGVFLLRQFMMTLPRELDESAMIDGAGSLTIYSRIILPLCKPALITLALFAFQGNWNDFMWPLLVTDTAESRTLTAGLYIFQGSYSYDYGKLMAGALLSAVPVLALFVIFQKYFVKGISFTGLKG